MDTSTRTARPTGAPPPAPRLSAATTHARTPGDARGGRGRRTPSELAVLLRDRLPELLATVGAALLVAAVAGFVVSRWTALDNLGQAALLLAGSVVLTLQGSWSSRRPGRLVRRLVPLSWAAAAGLTLVATQLVLDLGLPDATRLAIAGAGLVAAGHAAWLWSRRPDSIVLQVTTVAAALVAAGPVGTSVADGWDDVDGAGWAVEPVLAIVGLGGGMDHAGSDAFALVGALHLVVAVAWIACGLRLRDAAGGRVARVGGAVLAGWSALELNAMAAPIGSSLALLVVLGFLVLGVALEDGLLLAFGVAAGLVTGLRTVWSLFTGETAVTLTVALAGTALLVAALRLGRARDDDEGDTHEDAGGDQAGAGVVGQPS